MTEKDDVMTDRNIRVRRLLEAQGRFLTTGRSDVHCDRCGDTIQFHRLGDNVEKSSCSCGRYNSTLKGL